MTPDEQTISEILNLHQENHIPLLIIMVEKQCIAFAEWVDREGWRQTVGNNPVWLNENMQGKSTDQLYTLFLNHQ
jgi:hypothetical protein